MSPVRLLPWVAHEAIEYLAGIFFVIAPLVFGFRQTDPASSVFVGVGVLILAVAILSKGPAGVLRIIPPVAHAAVDYLLGFFLVLAPFVFRFSMETPARTISILLGVTHLVITLVTRFPEPDAETA
ncbi:MAG: SPW repeat domain-containing protein [Pseudonocardiaceae bacterium]